MGHRTGQPAGQSENSGKLVSATRTGSLIFETATDGGGGAGGASGTWIKRERESVHIHLRREEQRRLLPPWAACHKLISGGLA